METINHEYYISLEVAQLLKQAGFDWRCRKCYNNGVLFDMESDEIREQCPQHSSYDVLAPTLDVAQRWLRKVKSIEAVPWRWPTKVLFVSGYKPWSYRIITYKDLENVDIDDFNASGEDYFKTFEEAQEAGIKKALEIILEKG